ncbi:MAG: hypothetical protein ACOVRB_04680 [Akkermansiaceae bacterium]
MNHTNATTTTSRHYISDTAKNHPPFSVLEPLTESEMDDSYV